MPTKVEIASSDVCTVSGPPAPGLQAMIEGSHVIVEVDAGKPPASCAPAFVVVLLANTRGHGQVSTHSVRIQALGLQRVDLPFPSYFSAAPDVVRAYTVTERGVESEVSSVAVQH